MLKSFVKDTHALKGLIFKFSSLFFSLASMEIRAYLQEPSVIKVQRYPKSTNLPSKQKDPSMVGHVLVRSAAYRLGYLGAFERFKANLIGFEF